MPVWTCPNTECSYDKQLQHGQQCPLCEEEARGFSFIEFGDVLKEKESFKKSTKIRDYQELSQRIKFCPKCGSTNINILPIYRPSIWKCLDCGYEGAFIVEDSKLAEKIREKFLKTVKEE